MNWLNYLKDKKLNVRVLTMRPGIEFTNFSTSSKEIQIKRFGSLSDQRSFFRYLNYFIFYIRATWDLIVHRPKTVMYYETLSALPAIIYKKIFNKGSRLLVHYHEYTSPIEYQQGMKLNKWGHQLEKKTYPLYSWISHTNSERMKHFIEDDKLTTEGNLNIFPNYPPLIWQKKQEKPIPGSAFRFVYVGALSLDTMFTKEFAEWIIGQEGKATWDIYSTNITEDSKKYLASLKGGFIRFHGGVDYFSLPGVLESYDAGVILYKGHIPNYVYNAPNKLFEYWACDLDVWFPENMKGSMPFVNTKSYPKIIAMNFEHLNDVNLDAVTNRSGLQYGASKFYCERIFDNVAKKGLGLNS